MMAPEKVRRAVEDYRDFIEQAGISPEQLMDRCPKNDEEAMAHIASMFDRLFEFLDQGRIGKAYRWLGFIQGALWRSGIYNVNDLKYHNKQ